MTIKGERDYIIQACGELAFRKMCGLPIDLYAGPDATRYGEVPYPDGKITKVITTTDESASLEVSRDDISDRIDYFALVTFDAKTKRATFKGAISKANLLSKRER